jgi:hypothetical protein
MLVVYDITSRQSWESVKRWVDIVRRSLPDHEPMISFILGTCALAPPPPRRLHVHKSHVARAQLNRSRPCGLLAVVGAKSDLTSQRQVSVEEGNALADEVGAIGWTEVSSLTGVNGKQP